MRVKLSGNLFVALVFLILFLVQCKSDPWLDVKQRYPSFQLLPSIPGYQYRQPRWSPDGTQIAYMGVVDISIINSNGTQQRSVTDRSLLSVSPDWSPDGKRIAFALRNNGSWDIYTMNVDGSNIVQLTHLGNAGAPRWSPDGKRIAFNYKSGKKEDSGIYLMDTDGTNITQLTHYPLVVDPPEWSPDSMYIVFAAVDESPINERQTVTAGLNKSYMVYTVKVDGSDLRLLTKDRSGTYPVWSPDGKSILFVSRASPGGFYLVGADGSGLRITLDAFTCDEPSWSWTNNRLVCACWETPQVSQLCTIDMKDVLK